MSPKRSKRKSQGTESGSLKWLLIVLLALLVIAGIIYAIILYQPAKTAPAAQKPINFTIPPDAHPKSQPTSLQIPANDLSGDYVYAGLPRSSAPVLVITNKGFLTGYSETLKNPVWTCYRLFRVKSLEPLERPKSFSTDERTQSKIKPSDYTHSGFDRGHQAPNYSIAVCYGKEAQLETFEMSNILPQQPTLNQEIWMRLEQVEMKDWAQNFETVWIITGPVFEKPIKTLKQGVAVPAACYKLIADVDNGQLRVLGFLMPQDAHGDFASYLDSIDDIERRTGLDFYAELPDAIENKVEGIKAIQVWPYDPKTVSDTHVWKSRKKK